MLQTWIRHLEKFLSHNRLGCFLYARPYRAVIEREWSLLNLEKGSRIVLIGAGAIPFTAIWLARDYNCHVDAYDLDAKAIKHAKKVVKKLRLEQHIHLFEGTTSASLKPYDAAFIALQVSPLDTVIETLLTSGTHRLVVRRPSQNYADQYNCLSSHFRITGRVFHPLKAFAESVCVER